MPPVGKTIEWNIYQNTNIFIQEIVAILSQWVGFEQAAWMSVNQKRLKIQTPEWPILSKNQPRLSKTAIWFYWQFSLTSINFPSKITHRCTHEPDITVARQKPVRKVRPSHQTFVLGNVIPSHTIYCFQTEKTSHLQVQTGVFPDGGCQRNVTSRIFCHWTEWIMKYRRGLWIGAWSPTFNGLQTEPTFGLCNHSPDSKVHVAHMGPTWILSVPGGPHVGPMNLGIMVQAITTWTDVGLSSNVFCCMHLRIIPQEVLMNLSQKPLI